jgi:Raf kinase inhibitor-like YbhB/YbcL family protein
MRALVLIFTAVFVIQVEAQDPGKFTLDSHTVADGVILDRYTCDGVDISPPLFWKNPPAKTKSFALIVEDPDAPDPKAPTMVWTHWVLYNIPASAMAIEEGSKSLPPGTQEGLNDWQKSGYGGPCPAIGEHRYYFKLYALKSELKDLRNPTKKDLEKAMKGQVLGTAELMGKYTRKK